MSKSNTPAQRAQGGNRFTPGGYQGRPPRVEQGYSYTQTYYPPGYPGAGGTYFPGYQQYPAAPFVPPGYPYTTSQVSTTSEKPLEEPKQKRGIVVSRPDSKEVIYDHKKGTNNLRVSAGTVRNTTPESTTTPTSDQNETNSPTPPTQAPATIQVSAPVAAAPAPAPAPVQVSEPQPQKVGGIVVSLPSNKNESPAPKIEEKDSKAATSEGNQPADGEKPVVSLENQIKPSDSENEQKESNENKILPETKPEEQIQPKSEEKEAEKQEEITKELQIESEPTKTQEKPEEKAKETTENAETPKEQVKQPENEQTSTESDAKPSTDEQTSTESDVKAESESKVAEQEEKKEESLPKPDEIEEESDEREDSWETKGDEELNESIKEHVLNKVNEEETNRKRVYSKDFLLQFQQTNTSRPAELQNIDQILPASKQEPSGQSNDRFKNSGGSKGGYNNRGSGGGSKSGGNRKNFNNKKAPASPKVNPKLLAKEKLTERQKSLNSAKSILNKIAPDTFDKLSKEIGSLVTPELLEEITELIFEKAVTEPKYADLYAKLCVRLLQQDSTGFRKKLLSLCQKEFEQLKEHESNKELEVLVSETGDDYQIRKRMRGNMEFVGELFNQPSGISSKIIFICFKELIHESFVEELTPNQIKGINVKLEAFCKLATTVGKKLDQQNQKSQDQSLDYYFKILKELYLTSSLIEPRLKFGIQDVIELRLNRWVPRREAEKPKTIQEVHAAAAKQEQQKALIASSPSRGKPHYSSSSRPETPKSNLRNSGEWQSGGGKGGKGAKKPVKPQSKSNLVTQKNTFEQLNTKAAEKPKELDKDKFKGKSFIFMEEIYGIGEVDLSEFDVLSEEPTSEERNLLVENILAFLSEKNKDIKLASKLLVELHQKKHIYPNSIEHGFTTIVKNFIDIVDDLPNFPTRIATMLSGLFPSILQSFAFLNEPLSFLRDEDLTQVVTNFVADLIKFTTSSGAHTISQLKLDKSFETSGIIATTKKLLANPSECAKWLENSAPLEFLSDRKLLEEVSKAVSNLFFKASFSDSPSEETLKEEQTALEKFSPVFKVIKSSDLLPVLKTFLKEGLYSRVEATITKF